jgi:hypothetical protein
MNRFLTIGYGALSYVIFLAAFLYAIGMFMASRLRITFWRLVFRR